MADVLFVISALSFVGLILITGYHLVRRTGRAKGFAFYAIITFIVFIVSGAVAGPSTTNESNDKVAIIQSYSGEETTQQEELDLNQQKNQNPSTGVIRIPIATIKMTNR